MDERDEEKLKREKAVNTLESFVYETQDKIESELLQSVSTEEEREKISKELSETSDWLYEDGMDATRKVRPLARIPSRSYALASFF